MELSARYINDRKLPDKAIDVIDEVGAMQMLVPPSKRKKKITAQEIEAVIATMARIPPKIGLAPTTRRRSPASRRISSASCSGRTRRSKCCRPR